MGVSFFPSTDAALLGWSLNFKTVLTAGPSTVYGVTAAQLAAYGVLHQAYATTLAACDPASRSKTAVMAKNQARFNLKHEAKLLANTVNGMATVSDSQRVELGLNVRAAPHPIPQPSTPPVIEVASTSGWTARVRLRAAGSGGARRGKPPGVAGASVFSHVGPTPPADIADWKFEGNIGRTQQNVIFSSALAPGRRSG
jgi:hypothetical protein